MPEKTNVKEAREQHAAVANVDGQSNLVDGFGGRFLGRREMPKIDLKKWVGKISVIEKVTEMFDKTKGNPFVLAETVALEWIGAEDKKKPIRATVILGLQMDDDGNPYVGIGSKADRILQSFKTEHYEALKGKRVMIQLQEPRKGSTREYLTFIAAPEKE